MVDLVLWMGQLLLAVAPEGFDGSWVRTVTELGSFALLAYFIVTVAPALVKKLLEAHNRTVAAFETKLDKMIETFKTEVQDVRRNTDRRLDLVMRKADERTEALAREIRHSTDSVSKLREELTKMRLCASAAMSNPPPKEAGHGT